jgi:glycerol-3-phosphate dehydrogenase
VGWLFHTIGLTIYDMLAGKLSLGKSKYISKKKQLNYFLQLNKRLISGVIYQDGQFDDSLAKYRSNRSRTWRSF